MSISRFICRSAANVAGVALSLVARIDHAMASSSAAMLG
jgi:hypothetical protein